MLILQAREQGEYRYTQTADEAQIVYAYLYDKYVSHTTPAFSVAQSSIPPHVLDAGSLQLRQVSSVF